MVRAEAKLAKGILFALKVWVICYHSLSNTIEHMSHRKEAPAELMWVEVRTIIKVIIIEKGVSSLPIVVKGRSMAGD